LLDVNEDGILPQMTADVCIGELHRL
jgi:hypothetical protein